MININLCNFGGSVTVTEKCVCLSMILFIYMKGLKSVYMYGVLLTPTGQIEYLLNFSMR